MGINKPGYKQELRKKLEEAEGNVANARLLVVFINSIIFAFLMSHDDANSWLGWLVTGVALIYALGVIVYKPYKRFPLLMSSAFSAITDSILVSLWLIGTGWGNSPFYILWYVSLVAVAMRFSRRETIIASLAYLVADMLVVLTDPYTVEITVGLTARFSYIIAIGFLGTFIAKASEGQIKDKLKVWSAREDLAEANETLEAQVQERTAALRETSQDLLDSIKYSKRIQVALTPTDNDFQSSFREHFIFYKPKELIGGDFYWVHQEGDKRVVAMVDCTGHGVPGAMLAVMGINLLERIVVGQKKLNPADILSRIDEYLAYTFSKYETNVDINDGMVASVCLIDTKTNLVQFAGAEQSLLVVRKGEVEELKADRFSLGKNTHGKRKLFTESEFKIGEGDSLYLYSDGMVDQFGGPKDKKFLKKRLFELVKTVSSLPMSIQGNLFRKTFKEWKGDNPQVDDVTVLGIKV